MKGMCGTSRAQQCYRAWPLAACPQQVMLHKMLQGQAVGLMGLSSSATCLLRTHCKDLTQYGLGLLMAFLNHCQQKQDLCRLQGLRMTATGRLLNPQQPIPGFIP